MNNGKKYLIISAFVLFVLIILVAILQSILTKKTTTSPQGVLIPTPMGSGYRNTTRGSVDRSSSSSSELPAITQEKHKKELIPKLPIKTDDFTIDYSTVMDKIVVTRKTDGADAKLDIWAADNGYSDVLSDYHDTLITNQTVGELDAVLGGPTKSIKQESKEQADALVNLIHGILNLTGSYSSQVDEINAEIKSRPTMTPTPQPKPTAKPTSAAGEPKSYNGYVYYSQCHGQYDNYELTSGCSLCQAGCGPTTVAMILSTYVDKKYTPPAVVELYRNITSVLCGTGVGDAKSVLSSHGLKTTDYIIANNAGVDVKTVVDDFREYLNEGWTIMALAYYMPNGGGGHYFWITDIDDKGNVMAFDPYYGMDQTPPINENVRNPFPTYRYAFGVKK